MDYLESIAPLVLRDPQDQGETLVGHQGLRAHLVPKGVYRGERRHWSNWCNRAWRTTWATRIQRAERRDGRLWDYLVPQVDWAIQDHQGLRDHLVPKAKKETLELLVLEDNLVFQD